MKNIAKLFAFVCLLFVSQSAYAVKTVTAISPVTLETTATTTTLSKKDVKKQARLEKRIAKIEKKAAAQDIDFYDDTEKWMWFWIFFWAVALALLIVGGVLSALGGFGLFSGLASLSALLGTISLIIWLVKMFA